LGADASNIHVLSCDLLGPPLIALLNESWSVLCLISCIAIARRAAHECANTCYVIQQWLAHAATIKLHGVQAGPIRSYMLVHICGVSNAAGTFAAAVTSYILAVVSNMGLVRPSTKYKTATVYYPRTHTEKCWGGGTCKGEGWNGRWGTLYEPAH
jgi:hypothetical protein